VIQDAKIEILGEYWDLPPTQNRAADSWTQSSPKSHNVFLVRNGDNRNFALASYSMAEASGP
jgi:hypothetical protein